MAEIDRLLAHDEDLELETRRHVSALYKPALVLLLGLTFSILVALLLNSRFDLSLVDPVAGGLVMLFVLRFGWTVARWNAERVLLTDRRVIEATGLLRKRVTSIPLRQVTSVSLERRVAGTLQRYGDLLLEVGEHGALRIERVPRVKAVYRRVVELAAERPPAAPLRLDEADTGPLPRVKL
jgi:uncharacterized membrane protein YdbT with pleckstrin-like domain